MKELQYTLTLRLERDDGTELIRLAPSLSAWLASDGQWVVRSPEGLTGKDAIFADAIIDWIARRIGSKSPLFTAANTVEPSPGPAPGEREE